MFYQRRAPDADAYLGERAEAAAGTTGAGNPFPESSLAEARNHSPARPSSLSTSISFPAPTCLVGLPRPAQMRRNRPRMGGNSASPASFPPPLLLTQNRATSKVRDWNFAVAPLSSMSDIKAGPIRRGALFLP